MNAIRLLIVLLVVLSLAACSSKKKAESTTPDTTSTGDIADTDTNNAADDGASTPPGASANLGPVIYFEFDRAELGDESRQTLDENAKWLGEDAKRTLLIEGHTDEVGTPEYNIALGERRAQSARDYLIRLGVDVQRIKIITFGEEKPASNEDALNRRSVFVATKK